MLRLTLLLAILAGNAIAADDDRESIELTVVLINLQSESLEADADDELLPLWIPGHEADGWEDELLRLRSTGVDVRVRQVVVTAYDGLPAHVQLFEEDHVCDDDDHADGMRRQAVLDLQCTPSRREDGMHSLEISFSDQTRDDAPWEEPVLHDAPAESSFPPFDMTAGTTSLRVHPDEWLTMGGTRSTSTNESGPRSESAQITLIHLSEE